MKTLKLIAIGCMAAALGCGDDSDMAMDYMGAYHPNAGRAPVEAPPKNEGDNYEAVGTNPYELAAADPFSTFAADVDTASYDIFRRDIGQGLLPVKAGVRLEEYVNYFSYDYSAPDADSDVPFAIALEAADSPFTAGATTLRIGIKGKRLEDVGKRPTNLVFLIDISGSMSSSDKLPLVQKVLTETLEVLDADDTVAIVTYAGSTGVALAPTKVSEKAAIAQTINSFAAGGSTAGAAGITLAYQQAEAAFLEGGINHVILCTDGDFNVGVSSTTSLVELIEQKRKSGITLTALGFGMGNLNDAMMEAVTNAGNGTYGVISDIDQAISYVHKRLISGLTFIAKDMKIQVVFNPEKVLAYRLLGYENRAIADEDFDNDAVDAGEVGAGHTVTALYEVIGADGAVPVVEGAAALDLEAAPYEGELDVDGDELVRVLVRWKDTGASEEDAAHETASALTEDEITDDFAATSADFRWATAIAAFAEILKASPYADDEHLGAIQAIVEANAGDAPQREEFVTLMAKALQLLAAR